jgi:tetratricopeptide (TPR) repeat protein
VKKGYNIWMSGNFNKYPEALELFQEASKEDPNNPEYHSAVGRIFFEMGEYEKSFKELKKTLSLNPQKAWIEAWTRICLGEIYEKRGDYPLALKEYDRAIKLNTTQNSLQEAYGRKILVQWKHKETLHFVFSYPQGGIADRNIDEISMEYQKKYSEISTFLGVGLNDKIQCYLFPSVEKAREIMGVEPGFSRPQVKQIYSLYGTEGKEPPGIQIGMVLSFYTGKTRNREPFFHWGFAEFLSSREENFEQNVIDLKNDEKFVPLLTLKNDFYHYPSDISFKESASFVNFLIDKYGLGLFKKAWVSEDIDRSLKKVYGKTFEELEKDFDKYLKDRDKIIENDKNQD